MKLRTRIWEIVEVAKPGDVTSRIFDISILSLIFLNVLAVIIGSVESIERQYGGFLYSFEVFSVIVFTIEYLLRVWSCTADERYSKPFSGRLRFTVKPLPLIDLFAFLPFYLPFVGLDLRFIRVIRLLRIVRLAKVGRYYSSLRLITDVLKDKKEELVLTLVIMFLLLITAASLIYYCENPIQPEVFSSIPSTMWWAVVTLTTVGYGDIYPITTLGKILASVIAVLGIGFFALPTGILGAGFVEKIQSRRSDVTRCPHCGKEIE